MTELKYNKKVHPPSEATAASEAAIMVQSEAIRRCVDKYLRNNNHHSVLTSEESDGRASIEKRVKNGEILVTYTDKDGRTVVCPPELYTKFDHITSLNMSSTQKIFWIPSLAYDKHTFINIDFPPYFILQRGITPLPFFY